MNLHHKQIIFLLSLIILLSSCSLTSKIRKADDTYARGEYYSAYKQYQKIRSRVPKSKRTLRGKIYFRLGECYRNLDQTSKAANAYHIAERYYAYSDSTIYLDLANTNFDLENYDKAAGYYVTYLHWKPFDSEALNGLVACQNISKMKDFSTRYIVKYANEFNSRSSSDFSPMFVGDDYSQIVFTSNRKNDNNRKRSDITGYPLNDIYMSTQNHSNKWSKPVPISDAVNTTDDEGTPVFNINGTKLYFTRCRTIGPGGQIFMTSRSGGNWTTPDSITLFKDSSITVAHPALSPDGNTLYFVSDAPGGQGGKDIWYSEKVDGKWGIPQNMGKGINTSGNEMFPYMRTDSLMYFASDGWPGFGGLDIFKAQKDSVGKWHVTNMMRPINSRNDDFGITFEGSREKGYFSSNRRLNKLVDDIYYFELPQMVFVITGSVTDDKGEMINDATIRLVGDNGDNVKTITRKDGTYRIDLARNTNYVMLASDRGYLNQSAKFNTYNLDNSKTLSNEFTLVPINRPVKMDNIFYEFGKYTLTPESKKGLNALIKILNDNPNIAIEISAHTDYVGSDQDNLMLSQKRAESVVDYLIKAGIEKGRLTAKGYGETKPVEVDKSLAKQYPFLKIGTILNEDFLKTLPQNQQDICNQINRRTEFKVSKTTYNLY